MSCVSRRVISALVLAATLTAAPVLAGEHPLKRAPSQVSAGVVARTLGAAWNRFASLWAAGHSLSDPFGNAAEGTVTPQPPPAGPASLGAASHALGDPFGNAADATPSPQPAPAADSRGLFDPFGDH